ncbi:MAG: acyl carrier protein [Deltaproteobacteria bacterium]|nr:acyl carrier protein [Deltaproteobacteria bacterium]
MSDISNEKIRKDVLEILAKLIDINTSEVTDTDRLREDLGLDSLQSMELMSRISDQYELDLEVEDVMDVETLGEVVEHLGNFIRSNA